MRRRVITLVVALLGGALLIGAAGAGFVAWQWNRAALDTTGQVAFRNPLAVPPLAPSHLDEQGRRVFDLTAGTGTHDLGAGPVATWGFNGDYLGPTLRARRGEQVVVNVDNQLPETTTVHWHGMDVPPELDGGPHQPIAPGERWSPSWRIRQPAATLWYHPHPHGETERHVYRGLAGMFLLDDEASDELALPREYGVDDFPVIVQDKQVSGGQLDNRRSLLSGVGMLGDTIVVNGTPGPYLAVTTERVRLRLLNASTARTYQFGFADDRRFALVGTDGGLLTQPHHTDRVMLSPGERAEIVVRVAPGEQPVLRSYPPELGVHPFSGRFSGADDRLDILQLRVADELASRPPVPEQLVEVPWLDPAQSVAERTFRLTGTEINGQSMAMDRIDTTVEAGTVETWQVRNSDGIPHNFHVHAVQFQVHSVAGQLPPPELRGWKDTVYLPPGVPYTLVMRFGEHTHPSIPYMFHCHLLYHEDQGMMGQFVVVEPGEQAGEVPRQHHQHHQDHGG